MDTTVAAAAGDGDAEEAQQLISEARDASSRTPRAAGRGRSAGAVIAGVLLLACAASLLGPSAQPPLPSTGRVRVDFYSEAL